VKWNASLINLRRQKLFRDVTIHDQLAISIMKQQAEQAALVVASRQTRTNDIMSQVAWYSPIE